MLDLDREEYLAIAGSLEPVRGWDFSRIRTHVDPVAWDYVEVVRRFLDGSQEVLDIATGGGEVFLSLADAFASGAGIDFSEAMVQTAIENARERNVGNVRFLIMPGEDLDLASASFDIVLNRHGPVFASEIVRVMRPGGTFITQQVGPHNLQEVFDAFEFGFESNGDYWRRHWKESRIEPQDQPSLLAQFQRLDCRIVARGEYTVACYFADLASLLTCLQAVPLPRQFDARADWPHVRRMLARCATPGGIRATEHRQLIIARKRG